MENSYSTSVFFKNDQDKSASSLEAISGMLQVNINTGLNPLLNLGQSGRDSKHSIAGSRM